MPQTGELTYKGHDAQFGTRSESGPGADARCVVTGFKPGGRKKKILVVDDDPQIRESLRKMLLAEGYEVALAACGREGIGKFYAERIDLLLLDVNLPDMSGWETARILMSADPFVPIVMITGKHNQYDLAVLSGVGALIEKPLNVPILLETITEQFSARSAKRPGKVDCQTRRQTIQRQNHSSPRILVADDDPDILRLNARILTRAGYLVDTAEDGAVAWRALKLNNYDLLITDNDMPNLSGIELIEHLVVARLSLPVVLVSGKMPTEELSRHPWLQIEAMLLKPYSVPEFLGKVEAAVGKPANPTGILR